MSSVSEYNNRAGNNTSMTVTGRYYTTLNRVSPNFLRKRPFFSMSSVKPVVKARRQVRQLRTLPTPAAHTRTSGTALEPTRHEHPGWQREEWFPAHEASQRPSRPSWPMAAPTGKNA